MSDLTPYFQFPGTAREALTFYGQVFGGTATVHTLQEFGRTDGPPDAVAHGYLSDGPVTVFASDATGGEPSLRAEGLMFSLLGTADPATLRAWFTRLAEGGQVIDDLQKRPWGDYDGRVVDRYGVPWLIGFQESESP